MICKKEKKKASKNLKNYELEKTKYVFLALTNLCKFIYM
ncbi:hypothetical protein BS732_4449 [Bacillus subtilis MB73/2]|nr:hypothetical protein BS732_4449 [Bacillus subtilis MB73/2]